MRDFILPILAAVLVSLTLGFSDVADREAVRVGQRAEIKIAAVTGPNGGLVNRALLPLGGALDVNRGVAAPSPPSNFVCRLEPSALAGDFADLDPIDSWVADTASTKTTECNQDQATGASQPQYVDSCSEFGGVECADFDGSADTLLGSSSGFATAVSLPYSMCSVAMRSASALSAIYGSSKTASYNYFAYTTTSSTMYLYDGTPSAVVDNFTGLSNTTLGVGDSFCLSIDASGDATLYLNNVDIVVGSLPGHTANLTGLALGSHGQAAAFLNGRIAEIVLYDREIASETGVWFEYTCETYGLGC